MGGVTWYLHGRDTRRSRRGKTKIHGDGSEPEHRGTAYTAMKSNDSQGENPTDREEQSDGYWKYHRQTVLEQHGLAGGDE